MKSKFECGCCSQILKSPLTYHTYESCLHYKLNDYRKQLGKQTLEIDIEAEDKQSGG
jgi:hypothetical protein